MKNIITGTTAIFALSLLTSLSLANAESYYLDPSAESSGDGNQDKPFKRIEDAINAIDGKGGTLWIAPDSVLTTPILIQKGGTPELPLKIQGQGSMILLGQDITSGPWTPLNDNEYRLEKAVPPHTRNYVTSPVFVNGLPLFADHPEGRGTPAWHSGKLRYDEEGKLIITLPDGLTLETATIVLNGSDQISGLQGTGGAHMRFKDFTIAFAGNDGFNFHNDCSDVVLDNVTAVFNGDQGISSHGECIVEVKNSEVAYNGSQSAGIVDIGNANTTYRNLRVHHNRNLGFVLNGSEHKIVDTKAYGNIGYNLPKPNDRISLENCTDGGTTAQDKAIQPNNPAAQHAANFPDSRLGRFLSLTSHL